MSVQNGRERSIKLKQTQTAMFMAARQTTQPQVPASQHSLHSGYAEGALVAARYESNENVTLRQQAHLAVWWWWWWWWWQLESKPLWVGVTLMPAETTDFCWSNSTTLLSRHKWLLCRSRITNFAFSASPPLVLRQLRLTVSLPPSPTVH